MSVTARKKAYFTRLFLATFKPSSKNAKKAGIQFRNSSRENLIAFYAVEFSPMVLLASIANRANMIAWLGSRAKSEDSVVRVFLDA